MLFDQPFPHLDNIMSLLSFFYGLNTILVPKFCFCLIFGHLTLIFNLVNLAPNGLWTKYVPLGMKF